MKNVECECQGPMPKLAMPQDCIDDENTKLDLRDGATADIGMIQQYTININ